MHTACEIIDDLSCAKKRKIMPCCNDFDSKLQISMERKCKSLWAKLENYKQHDQDYENWWEKLKVLSNKIN